MCTFDGVSDGVRSVSILPCSFVHTRVPTCVRSVRVFKPPGHCRYGCPLLFIVGVDDENRSCVLGQGLLRSECTETFKWFLESYESAAGGRRPKVRYAVAGGPPLVVAMVQDTSYATAVSPALA